MPRKKSESEEQRLTDNNLAHVISMLDPKEGKAWTKKQCCEYLGIAYNTTRLGTLIEKYKEKKEREARLRAAKRGKPATSDEIKSIITAYLVDGDAVSVVADDNYRSADFVKRVLEEYSVPLRIPGSDYFRPEMVPEKAMRDEFKLGEIVYSMRYDSCARIEGEFPKRSKDGERVYRVWLLAEKWQENAYQPCSELASLEHLVQLGIKL